MNQLNKPNYILNRTSGHNASLRDALDRLVKAKHRIAFTHDDYDEIPEIVTTELKKRHISRLILKLIRI